MVYGGAAFYQKGLGNWSVEGKLDGAKYRATLETNLFYSKRDLRLGRIATLSILPNLDWSGSKPLDMLEWSN